MENRKLKNIIKLSSKIAIFVPSTIDIDKKADTSMIVDNTLKLLASLYGGSTCSNSIGTWVSTSGELVKERIKYVYAYCTTEQLDASVDQVIDYCENLKKELGQEAIALEINNELYFI